MKKVAKLMSDMSFSIELGQVFSMEGGIFL